MRTTTGATTGGKYVGAHRRRSTRPSLGTVATTALAVGAVGATGTAALATGEQPAIKLVAHTEEAGTGAQTGTDAGIEATDTAQASPSAAAPATAQEAVTTTSPQILTMPQSKQLDNLANQLQKAAQYNQKRIAEENAQRGPIVVRPAEGTLTTGFEMRWGSFHKGIDIANALGTPEYAVTDATVISAGPASGFGNWVRLQADDGTIFVYGHMETINVTVGQRVTAGQVIAGMGSRGFSTGSHLHFEVYPDGKNPVDPIPWLKAHGIEMGAIYR